MKHEVEEHYPPAFVEARFHFVAGELGLHLGGEKPVLMKLV